MLACVPDLLRTEVRSVEHFWKLIYSYKPMNDYPDFSNYGYQVTRELGHNRAGGRVTYLAT